MNISTNKNELNLTENEMTLPVRQHREHKSRKTKRKTKIKLKREKKRMQRTNF